MIGRVLGGLFGWLFGVGLAIMFSYITWPVPTWSVVGLVAMAGTIGMAQGVMHGAELDGRRRLLTPLLDTPKPSGGHYHGDDECFCGQPKPCCDQGRIAYPHPCPWHPEHEGAS